MRYPSGTPAAAVAGGGTTGLDSVRNLHQHTGSYCDRHEHTDRHAVADANQYANHHVQPDRHGWRDRHDECYPRSHCDDHAQLDRCAGGDVDAKLRFQVQPQVAHGTPLTARLSYTWRDDRQTSAGRSNLLPLNAAAESIHWPHYQLLFSTIDLPGDHAPALVVFSGTIFAPHEPITFWYATSDGQDIAVRTVVADANGQVTLRFNPAQLAPGAYTMVARGNWTDFTATAPFQAP